jgi:CHAD domain-containing protein
MMKCNAIRDNDLLREENSQLQKELNELKNREKKNQWALAMLAKEREEEEENDGGSFAVSQDDDTMSEASID